MGLKPSAMECEARLRGLYWIIYSKTINLAEVKHSSRFRHQDAQTPPSPLVGEGDRGDEGQKRTGMPQTAPCSQERYP